MRNLLLVVSLLALPLSANAILITLDISGTVGSNNGTSTSFGNVGDPFAATLTIDTDLLPVDQVPDPLAGYYLDPLFAIDFVTSSLFVPGPGQSSDWVYLEDGYIFRDLFFATDYNATSTIDAFGNGTVDFRYLQIFIEDPTQTLLSTAALDENFALNWTNLVWAPVVSAGAGQQIWVNHENVSTDYSDASIRVRNITVAVTQVPEPGTLLLLSGGLIAVGFARRRRSTT